MKDFQGLGLGLGTLPLLNGAVTRSISAENPTGEKGKGAMAIPNPDDPDLPHSAPATELGQGWKVRPFLRPKAGQTLTLMDVDGPPKWSLYRWHIMDPICFRKDLRVTIQALGWWPNGKFQPLADDIASVAYWYQREPHVKFPDLPPLGERWPR